MWPFRRGGRHSTDNAGTLVKSGQTGIGYIKEDEQQPSSTKDPTMVGTTPTPTSTSVGDSRDRSSKPEKKSFWQALGPGLVTGASDNDPSGIATYSQAGAKFGYGQLWMSLVTFPLVVGVQEMCARIGLVTGKGLAEVIKENYSKRLLYSVTALLLVANTINIGADIGAMGASLRLLVPQLPLIAATVIFTAIILVAEVLIPYSTYSKILKYLTFSLFLYMVTAILVVHDTTEWSRIISATIVPHLETTKDFTMMIIAILGTTISPYLFFWQTAHEVEEEVNEGKIRQMGNERIHKKPKVTKKDVKFMRIDILAGMGLAQSIFWFIIITSASTLHNHGITEIGSAEEAAKSLEPLVKGFPFAGEVTSAIFAAGIIGTGLLAVPVLAASASYAVSEGFGWKEGLYKKFLQAPKFYAVIIASTVIGLWINFSGIDPIQALVYTAVINGFVSVPLLIIIYRIANSKKILGSKTNKKASNVLNLITILSMVAAAIAMVVFTWVIK